ncbi:vanin-like protein 2 [Drosophila willistoni]|nr:vanin-like protein 2 [Drosophila willistoni]
MLLLVYILILIRVTKQLSLPSDPTYFAGVVEFPNLEGSDRQHTALASEGYRAILESDQTNDLDIIVFPEYVLNNRETATFVPDPNDRMSPCISPDYEMFLVELSCAARSRKIYVVLNLKEKELCGPAYGNGSNTYNACPETGVRYFNTNVVLDREGRIISRYRKTHLWRHEYYKNEVLKQTDISYFDTDFGVTFGHFICFDMLFYEPAMQLVHEKNITDIIYPTYWFSELPFLTAVQLQEGWAFANNVNLLAADGSDPSGKTTGSGIYAGRAGRLAAGIFEEPTTRLITARVPKRRPGQPAYELPTVVQPIFQPQLISQRSTKLATFRDYNVDIFSSELLDIDFMNVSKTICHHDFCCDFNVQRNVIGFSSDHAAYRYRLAAYWGNETTFIRVDRSEQAVCALFACLDKELYSCGYTFPSTRQVANQLYFNSIKIRGSFATASRRLIMPSTLDGMMMPLSVAQYKWTETELSRETRVELELIQPKNDLLTFGIWANYFTKIPTLHNLDHMQPYRNQPQSSGTSNTSNANINDGSNTTPSVNNSTSTASAITSLCSLMAFCLMLQF